MKYQKIGVFLSSKADLPQAYADAAREVGRLIGEARATLVYGGSRCGLMEVLAQSVKQSGGRVYGVVPEVVERRGLTSDAVDVAFRCTDLNDRKAVLARESDVVLALPGGIGTLDEVFSVLATAVIGIERKPVIFYNVEGCWDGLLAALSDLFGQGLIGGRPDDLYAVAATPDELAALL